MSFDLNIKRPNGKNIHIKLENGDTLFILGTNGSGKSSLIQQLMLQHQNHATKISAHRQTWISTDIVDISPNQKTSIENNIKQNNTNAAARYRDFNGENLNRVILFNILDSENTRARHIAEKLENGHTEAALSAAKEPSPISILNDLLRQSNIPISIQIQKNGKLIAKRDNEYEYGINALSDGERNALFIAGAVLTAPAGTLFLIDEPERHLHRSIAAPFIKGLISHRQDCGFVISTHDHELPMNVPEARVLLLRSCQFNGPTAQSWEADLLPANSPIDDALKRDLLGSRRKILFIEGQENSLDKQLYALIFPEASVIPKGNCREVIQAVKGSRAAEDLHWLRAFGIVDGDGFDENRAKKLHENGVYTTPYYSVEAIYYHPKIIELMARRQSEISGEEADEMTHKAIVAGIEAATRNADHLIKKTAKKTIRRYIEEQIPNEDDLLNGEEITISNNANSILREYESIFKHAANTEGWETILTRFNVRESSSLDAIAKELGFIDRSKYQKAVRKLISDDKEALEFARGLFGDLLKELSKA